MLEQARENARAAGVQLDLREGDMRDLAVDQPAALIYCPFRALLHLPTWADRRCTFERVTASLQPGGRFAWNAFAFDHRIAARLDGERQDEPVAHTNRYSVGDNRIDITLDSGAKSSLWWATKNEWLGLIDVAELELEALYGGFAREPLTDDSNDGARRQTQPRAGDSPCRALSSRATHHRRASRTLPSADPPSIAPSNEAVNLGSLDPDRSHHRLVRTARQSGAGDSTATSTPVCNDRSGGRVARTALGSGAQELLTRLMRPSGRTCGRQPHCLPYVAIVHPPKMDGFATRGAWHTFPNKQL